MPRLIALLVVAALGAPHMPARATVKGTCTVMVDTERAATLVVTAGTCSPS
jgi:hypothetical protein